MPIKDLQKNKPGLARAGVIRLGYKVKKCNKCKEQNYAGAVKCKCGNTKFGKIYPIPADHFVLTDAPGVTEAIKNPKPTELRIYLPFNGIEQNFPAYHQYWVASALICRGDGEHIQYGINPQSGDIIIRDGQAIKDFETKDGKFRAGDIMTCPGMTHDTYTKCQHCKPNAMLIVLLRDMPRLAYYQIATTSIHNIVNLTEQLTYIQETIGRLQGVPFILKLRSRKISVPKNGGGRMRTEKYLLSLEVDPEWVQRLFTTQNQLANPERQLLSETTIDDDIIDIELSQQPPSQSSYSQIEPPVWIPPNGNDDSDEPDEDDYETTDLDRFYKHVLDTISWYTDPNHISDTMTQLELVYNLDDEESIYDSLAQHANAAADAEADAVA